jgi:tetratricopeptide (TPR) repeat protein
MITRLLAILFLSTVVVSAYSQDGKADEYRLQQEQIRRTALLRELDSGVLYMDDGKYEIAEKKFRYVLDNIRSVPSDLVFYFGKNSFYRENYKQSIDWLNKYIQLKGTNGQFSNEAITWLKKAEGEFLHEKSKDAKKAEQVLSTSYEVDCGPGGKVVCPVCKGEHVVIKRASLGTEYRTCPYCDEHGVLTCAEYNQLVRGELKPKN